MLCLLTYAPYSWFTIPSRKTVSDFVMFHRHSKKTTWKYDGTDCLWECLLYGHVLIIYHCDT